MWVHDTAGTKLDGRVKEGRWVGFDKESKAHRIYYPGKRSVGVERSVVFAPEDVEVVLDGLALEGEDDKLDEREEVEEEQVKGKERAEETEDAENERPTLPTSNAVPNDTPTIEEPTIEEPEAPVAEGRGHRIRKESAYVRQIREGVGHASNLPKSRAVPLGIQVVDEVDEAAANENESGRLADEWEIPEGIDFAMATVMDAAEGLNPTYEEAKTRPDWPKWKEVIEAEWKALVDNGTWKLVERPEGANVVGCKWVLKIKRNAVGGIEKYKARLVARGFTQIHGVDYYEMYAPVARLATLRLLLATANRNNWPIESFDFDSAYLNSVLKANETVYMEQPKGYEQKSTRCWVFKLLKALYGLKQGAKNWYDALLEALLQLGFQRTEADHGTFIKKWADGQVVILAVHVDDCLVTGSSKELISRFKVEMNEIYKLTDLGPCTWLLGIKITRDLIRQTIMLSQHAYINAILTCFNFDDLKPSAVPMDHNQPLGRSQCPSTLADIARMKNVPYREAVGSLMYAAMGTRPDITFGVTTVAQFMDNPGWVHWEAVKRIFRYLKGTKDYELVYGGEKKDLTGFVDADGASQEHRHAISGYVFMVDGGAVSWLSKKQELVTLSTTEAEYVAATHAAKEAVWLRRIMGELFSPLDEPTTLYGDNQSAIALAHGGQYHARTKHIDIRYHFIRYIIEAGSIKLIYCPTDEQTADVLTKALPSVKAKHFASAMGLARVV